jgi:RNA polymerase sigma-70 factor (ECF subfamily)
MGDSPSTRASLLVRLRDPRDERAWAEFVDLYTPLLRRLARAKGLQDADAADLAQDVFRAVAGAIDRFDLDPARGSFRAWLSRIGRNLAINALADRRRHPAGSGDTRVARLLDEQPGPDPNDTVLFQTEYRREVFRWAAGRCRAEFRESTWRAFWRTSVEGEEPANVARSLGMTVGAVYVARSRVMARLRREVEGLEPDAEPTAGENRNGDTTGEMR